MLVWKDLKIHYAVKQSERHNSVAGGKKQQLTCLGNGVGGAR